MSRKFVELNDRILVDIDNERRYDQKILGLSQSDEVEGFNKNTITLKEGDYVYTFTENHSEDEISYIFAEGYVIQNPYPDLPYKWCCRLVGDVEFSEDYNRDKSNAKFTSQIETYLKSTDPTEALRNYVLELNKSGISKEELYKIFHLHSIKLYDVGRKDDSALLEDIMDMMTGWYSGKNLDLD